MEKQYELQQSNVLLGKNNLKEADATKHLCMVDDFLRLFYHSFQAGKLARRTLQTNEVYEGQGEESGECDESEDMVGDQR